VGFLCGSSIRQARRGGQGGSAPKLGGGPESDLSHRERDIRPGGAGRHTDRRAGQIEAGSSAGLDDGSGAPAGAWWAAAQANPASSSVALAYRASASGLLRWELFDSSGRLLHGAEQPVDAAGTGTLQCGAPGRQGVFFYRLRLCKGSGREDRACGRIVVLR
jgi:hypothetical protein